MTSQISLQQSGIEGVVLFPLIGHEDDRGVLIELFRNDQIPNEFHPVMSYISYTKPGIQRGPHEHVSQADLFCFVGPSNFLIKLWDNRRDSNTFEKELIIRAGKDNPTAMIVPAGVVHAYKNVGEVYGMVINCPNRLYMGEGRKEPIDEIRHEDDPDTVFKMD